MASIWVTWQPHTQTLKGLSMANYAIFIDGQNFLLNVDGSEKRLGFFVTKRVVAESEDEAIELAFSLIRSDPKLASAYEKAHLVEPTLSAEVVHQLLDNNEMNDTGYTFYPMEKQ